MANVSIAEADSPIWAFTECSRRSHGANFERVINW